MCAQCYQGYVAWLVVVQQLPVADHVCLRFISTQASGKMSMAFVLYHLMLFKRED